ncbi:MAG TPA: WD40 repeat domain-containing protein [bacterium]|nr:WD40 repeat domain-containing protein [bacterium]
MRSLWLPLIILFLLVASACQPSSDSSFSSLVQAQETLAERADARSNFLPAIDDDADDDYSQDDDFLDDDTVLPEPLCTVNDWCWHNPLPQGNMLRKIEPINDNEAYIIGYGGTFFRYNNAGEYENIPTYTTDHFTDLAVIDRNDVYVMSETTIYHYDGSSFEEIFSQSLFTFHDIWVSPTGALYAGGGLRHYDWTWWDEPFLLKYEQDKWGYVEMPDDCCQIKAIVGDSTNNIYYFCTGNWYDTYGPYGGGFFHLYQLVNDVPVEIEQYDTEYSLADSWISPHGIIYTVGYTGLWQYKSGYERLNFTAFDDFSAYGGHSAGNEDIYLAGGDGAIRKRIDGVWLAEETGVEERLYDIVKFSSETSLEHLLTVGSYGIIMENNSGIWRKRRRDRLLAPVNASYGSPPMKIFGFGPDDIYLGFEEGEVYHFNGTEWRYVFQASGEIRGIWGVDSSDLFIADLLHVYHYDGTEWELQFTYPFATARLTGLWGTSGHNVYTVSNDGNAYHYNGVSWAKHEGIMGFYGSISYFDIWGTAGNNIFIAASDGNIVHWNGSCWSLMGILPTEYDFVAIWATDNNYAFAIDEENNILMYNGRNWQLVYNYPYHYSHQELHGIFGTGPDDVYVVGSEGVILHYNGSTWREEYSGTRNELLSVWASREAGVFVSGNVLTILHKPPKSSSQP